MRTTKFVLEVPNDMVDVVAAVLDGKPSGFEIVQIAKATALISDFVDKVKSMSRQTADNHMAYFPHGNSIDREE